MANHFKTKHALLAYNALAKELYLTPKPGLVDMYNSGSHKDMDIHTFITSLNAIAPWLDEFYNVGITFFSYGPVDFLSKVRLVGIECENAMFSATKQINTHKGGIFAFALLLSSIGRLEGKGINPTTDFICKEVAMICENLVHNELVNMATKKNKTSGEKLFLQYGLTGARGEAASGYAIVRNKSLPIYLQSKQQNISEKKLLLHTFIHLLAYNNDTNLVSRGGLEGLLFAQEQALSFIDLKLINSVNYEQHLLQLDRAFIKKNLSPGGSADLLSVTWFLAQYHEIK